MPHKNKEISTPSGLPLMQRRSELSTSTAEPDNVVHPPGKDKMSQSPIFLGFSRKARIRSATPSEGPLSGVRRCNSGRSVGLSSTAEKERDRQTTLHNAVGGSRWATEQADSSVPFGALPPFSLFEVSCLLVLVVVVFATRIAYAMQTRTNLE